MTIITRTGNGGIVIEASGRLVAGGPEFELRAAVRRAIDSGCRRVFVVLCSVTMIDAAGIGAVVAAVALARERRVWIALVEPSQRVATLLSLTGVTRVVTIVPLSWTVPAPSATSAGTRTARRGARDRGDRPSGERPSGS